MDENKFSFEELEVWKKSVTFAINVIELIDKLNTKRKHFRLIEQLEAAATSIAMNIAEGKGRYSKKEFIQFLYYARGSLFETITLLIILNQMNWIDNQVFQNLKTDADEIGKMISGLISSIKKSSTQT
ncbi:MAG: four helix bundle protein [Marinilabiliales bacterium]